MSQAPSESPDDALVLTCDLGTSGPKVALFTFAGEYVSGEFHSVELLLDAEGKAEQRPDDWWTAIVACCDKLAKRGELHADRIAAISVTSQWSGTVPVDADLNPLFNAITWMDTRGAPDVEKLMGGPLAGYQPFKLRLFIKLTGGAPSHSGKDPLGHILWFERTQPQLAAKVACYLEPKDYLNARLCGRAVATYDSITLHWLTDNRTPGKVTYAPELLGAAGIDRAKLPELVPATSAIGELRADVAEQLGVPAGIPVVGGTPDLQSAAVGSGAVRDYEGHLYIGTSSWLTCHVPNKKTDVLSGIATLPSPLPNKYYVADEQDIAGAALNWLRDQVLFPRDLFDAAAPPDDVFVRLDRLAESSPAGANGVIFTPWLNGERTPVEDHTIRGGWHHLSLRSSRADLVRSVLEGVAFNSRWLMDTVEKFVGRPFPWLHMIGGGAQSALWCQIHADVLNREIRQVRNPIVANARGAAFIAGLALDRITLADISSHTDIEATFTPNAAHRKLYEAIYGQYVKIYKANKRIHRTLDGIAGAH